MVLASIGGLSPAPAQTQVRGPRMPTAPGSRAQPTPVPAPAPTPAATPAPAAVAPGGTVREIRIDGIERVEAETIRSYLVIQPGDPFDNERIDRSLKALFATGLFADVAIRREGDGLVVKVVENPIINRIAFEGNRKLSDNQLSTEVQLKPRVVFTRTKVQADVKRILELYRRNGRFAATVDAKVIKLAQNRVDLVFEIDEGASTGIKSINFIGSRQFSVSKLKEVISTRESRWYRFFSSDDIYDPDRLTYDKELLRKFYLSQGYADFRVISAVAELTPERDGFAITVTVEEGHRYRFGKIAVNSGIKQIPGASLLPLVTVHSGEFYDAEAVEHSISVLTNAIGNRGYAFIDIKPHVTRHREGR